MNENETIRRSVNSLSRIYSVVVALAVTISIQRVLLDSTGNVIPFFGESGRLTILRTIFRVLPSLIAFIVTIVPFYHGMNRHLDLIYLEKPDPKKQGYLLWDFVVFFLESWLLVAFAYQVSEKDYAFLVLIALLLLDTAWALITHGIHYRDIRPSIKNWAIINFIACIGLFAVYFANWFDGAAKSIALCIVSVVRTIVDYTVCWRFYFPETKKAETLGTPVGQESDS